MWKDPPASLEKSALWCPWRRLEEKYVKLAYQPEELFMGWEAHKK